MGSWNRTRILEYFDKTSASVNFLPVQLHTKRQVFETHKLLEGCCYTRYVISGVASTPLRHWSKLPHPLSYLSPSPFLFAGDFSQNLARGLKNTVNIFSGLPSILGHFVPLRRMLVSKLERKLT